MKHVLLNLQRFAEEDPDAGAGDPVGKPAPVVTPPAHEEDKPFKSFKTEDDLTHFLDSAYDKRFAKSIDGLKAKWQSEQNDQKSYDKMTDAEKAAYNLKQSQAKLDEREKEVTIKENRANITNKLAEDGLPVSLAKAFSPAFSDTDNLETTYKAVTEGFREALKTGVDKALSSSAQTPHGSGSDSTKSTGQILAEKANKKAVVKDSIWTIK
ncbi:DUF4355 domain-containing protein [Oenococcus sicerae]|uniref:DUF4355 domain-containing protein n=1 Tax=Oenococcus sicerae TaxID=2203724 RepID=UPI0039EC6792